MTTDTSEKELERLICAALTGAPCDPPQGGMVRERPSSYGAGWICGDPQDYDREYCVDLAQLSAFLHATQPVAAESLDLSQDSPTRRKFLARLQGEVTRRGTIDVLRKGIKHGPHQIDLMYGTPSPGNEKAHVQYAQNRFSVTRQLRYSNDNAQLALDLGLFINGLPVAGSVSVSSWLTRSLDKRPNRALIFLTTGWMYAYTVVLYPHLMRYYIPVLNVRGPKGGTSHAKRTKR